MMLDAVIIGGGISGLTAAYNLHNKNREVHVLEGSSNIGGNIRSVCEEGCLFELGPNTLRNEYPELENLIGQLELTKDIESPESTSSYIAYQGKLNKVPNTPLSAVTSGLLPASSKFRIICEPFAKSAQQEESVADFVARRFGKNVTDNLAAPMVSGIYAGDAAMLSITECFPKLTTLEKEYGSLLKGMLAARKKPKRITALPKVFSFKNGVSQLTDALALSLRDKITTNSRVTKITKSSGGYFVESDAGSFSSRNVIVSTPAYISAELIAELDSSLSVTLKRIDYPPVVVVHLVYEKKDVKSSLNGFGFLVADKEKSDVLGCVFSSSMYPHRAPADKVVFAVMMGGALRRDVVDKSDEEVLTTAHSGIGKYITIDSMPTLHCITRHHRAIPQYTLGYGSITEEIVKAEGRNMGLHFLANYRGGISVGSCVRNAMAIQL